MNLHLLLITRIAVLKHALKTSANHENRNVIETTLEFNLEIFKATTGHAFMEGDFKFLPIVRSYKTNQAYKDNGGLYYDLYINGEKFESFFNTKDAKETVAAVIAARKADYGHGKDVIAPAEVAHA